MALQIGDRVSREDEETGRVERGTVLDHLSFGGEGQRRCRSGRVAGQCDRSAVVGHGSVGALDLPAHQRQRGGVMSTRTVASLQRQVTPRIHRIYATLILDVPDNEYMLVAHGTDGPIYLDAEDDREALVDTVLELGLADDDEIHVFDDPELPLGRLVPAGVVLREYATDDRRDRLIEDGRLP